jgi:hypothetical protein
MRTGSAGHDYDDENAADIEDGDFIDTEIREDMIGHS